MDKLHKIYRKLQKKRGISPDDQNPLVMTLDNEKDKSFLQSHIKEEFGESLPLDLEKADDMFLEAHRLDNGELEATILMEYHNGLNNYSTYFEAKHINETQIQEVLRNLGPNDKMHVHLKGKDYQEISKKLRSYFVVYPAGVGKQLHEKGKKYEENDFSCIDADVLNNEGLHLRLATTLAKTATKYKSEIFIQHGNEKANGKSVLSIMVLCATKGARIAIKAKGPDADEALNGLYHLIQSGFGEKQYGAAGI